MRSLASLAFAIGTTLALVSVAHADRVRVSGSVALAPVGTFVATSHDVYDSAKNPYGVYNAATAYGFGADVGAPLGRYLSISFAPQFLFGVETTAGFPEPGKELDLIVRIAGRKPIGPESDLYVYASPGYSILFLPDALQLGNPSGITLGAGAGLSLAVSPHTFIVTEAGYQLGYQTYELDGKSHGLGTRYLHFGLGFGARI